MSTSTAPPRHDAASANAYLRTRVLTASPEELRLMLLDGAIKFTRQGAEGLERRDYEASYTGLTQARNIITELMTSVRADIDADLCAKIRSLYTFMFNQLVEASLEKDAAKAAKIVELLEYERETWALLMQKLAGERGAEPQGPEATKPQGQRAISVEA